MTELRLQHVWDAGTRWFHWITTVCVLLLISLGLLILNASSLDIPNSGKITAAPGIDPSTLQPYAVDTYNAAAYDQMRSIRKPIATVHLYSFYSLAALVSLHILAVVVTEIRERSGLVSAMITGFKTLPDSEADSQHAEQGK